MKLQSIRNHLQVATEWYVQACIFDICALSGKNPEDDDAVVCHYLSAYAMDASKQGIRLSNWRKPGLCGEATSRLFILMPYEHVLRPNVSEESSVY